MESLVLPENPLDLLMRAGVCDDGDVLTVQGPTVPQKSKISLKS